MAKVDFKVVLLGNMACGKTSLFNRFINERFVDKYFNTIGAAFGSKTLRIDEKDVTLSIWDTAGSEKYLAMTKQFYRNAKAALICYAVDDSESWDKVEFWLSELRKVEPDCVIYITATKLDLVDGDNRRRAVDYHNTTDYASTQGAQLFETSSKTGYNVAELFDQVARDYLSNPANFLESLDDAIRPGTTPGRTKKQKCCGSKKS